MRLFILFLLTLLLQLSLCANEYFLLPEQKADLLYSLKRKIARADQISIVTPQLHFQSLSRSIEKALKKGATLTLITSDLNSASIYAKFKNSRVKVAPQNTIAQLHLTLLLIDQSDVCFTSIALSEESLHKDIGNVICTTNNEDIAFAQSIIKKYSERFVDY